MLIFCGVGFLSVFAQKEIPLHNKTDKKWGIKQSKTSNEEGNQISLRDKTDTEGVAPEADSRTLGTPI